MVASVSDKRLNAANVRVVARGNNNALAGAGDDVGGEEGQVLSLAEVFVGKVWATLLGIRLAREGRVVDLHARGGKNANVGRNLVAILDLDHIANHKRCGINIRLQLAVTPHAGLLWNKL